MSSFTSFDKQIEQLLITIVNSNELHAKWLNTLSFLENCGARKIAACQHPTLVKEEMLRAEELYPIYDVVLRKAGSRVAVKSILLEEKEHLAEMKEGLNQLSSGFIHAEHVCAIESNLCRKWLNAIESKLYIFVQQ